LHKALSETRAALEESCASAAVRDEVATDNVRVTDEMAVFGTPA
jgi:hypothetical protein